MLHARFIIERLAVDGTDLPLRHGGLVVAARAESPQLDWEVVSRTLGPAALARGRHHLSMRCLDGDPESRRILEGPAFLVRRVGDTLVFRGTGTLEGVDVAELSG